MDFPDYAFFHFVLGNIEIILPLQAHPKLRCGPHITSQPHGQFRANATLATQELNAKWRKKRPALWPRLWPKVRAA